LVIVLVVGVAACGGTDVTHMDGAPGHDGPAVVDAPPGTPDAPFAVCGGLAGTPCPSDQFCDFPDNSCGGADQTGTCKPKPGACPAVVLPLCGCDGTVYSSECNANSAGVDVADNGHCTPPSGQFECGSGFCTHGSDYCQVIGSDAPPFQSSYTCKPLPAACGAMPSCACTSGEMCGSVCNASTAGDLTLTCLGG
jgi:hypothetical protein